MEKWGLQGTYKQGKCTSHIYIHQISMRTYGPHPPHTSAHDPTRDKVEIYPDMLRSLAYLRWARGCRNGASEAPVDKVNAPHTSICITHQCTPIAHTHPLPWCMLDLRYIRDIPKFAEIPGLSGVGLGVENRGLRGAYSQGKCTSHTHICIRYPCTHIAHTHPLPLYMIT